MSDPVTASDSVSVFASEARQPMPPYAALQTNLQSTPKTWLLTGVAGFLGSNLLEALLKLNQRVDLDNFAIGHQRNLDEVETLVNPDQWKQFNFIQGDIRNLADCKSAMEYRLCKQSAATHAPSVFTTKAQQPMTSTPHIYNIALGDPTTLNELYTQLKANLLPNYSHLQDAKPVYRNFRAGDVRHSLADISKAQSQLGYAPTQRIAQGLALAMH
jgi:nucleoside-diphosphate-sugar epimerase